MLQSGLTRLRSVFASGNGDQAQERERHHPKAGRSVSVGVRPAELSRQILVKVNMVFYCTMMLSPSCHKTEKCPPSFICSDVYLPLRTVLSL